jgi:cytochrome c biogenesis protein CcmG, thiol:disulfide interchange protein DsbE
MLKGIATVLTMLLTGSLCHALPVKGDRAPDFRGGTNTGTVLSLADYSGKVVVLDFFATWCASCRQLTPLLVDIEKRYKVKIIGMDVDDSGEEKINAYIRKYGISFPVLYADDKVQSLYGIRSVPVIYVIGKDGIIVGKYQGFNKDIAASLESLIKSIN